VSPTPPVNTDESPSPHTLRAFIEANQKQLSALGVLSAISALSRALPIRPLGDVISFCFLAATFALWFELQEQFPKRGASTKLIIFETGVSVGVSMYLFHWLLQDRFVWSMMLVLLLFFGFSVLTTRLLQRLDAFNRLFGIRAKEKRGLRRIVYYTLQIAIFLAAFALAGAVGVPTNRWLDSIRAAFDAQTRSDTVRNTPTSGVPNSKPGSDSTIRGTRVDSASKHLSDSTPAPANRRRPPSRVRPP
jgi:hypothetical protein